jgi:hypothetical protein
MDSQPDKNHACTGNWCQGHQYGTESQRYQGFKVLKSGTYVINPKKKRYGCLETDEFWTYAGKKKNKVWLIYAYHRESGEIAAYVWGKRGIKTAEKDKRAGNKL